MRLAFVFATLLFVACGPSADPGSNLDASTSNRYPTSPQESMTPGALCQNPSEYRYPEHIPYCNRSVSTSVKNKVIKAYDATFDYTIAAMPRNDFKIDHYIPLCMGGANETTNLWPQHKSVYIYTDDLEQTLCLHMERGHITQAKAISYIKAIKRNPTKAENARINAEIDQVYGDL